MQPLHLRCDGISVTVSPAAGSRLSSLRVDGSELLVTRGIDSLAWGCYPMVPYAGRVRDAVLHFGGRDHALRPNDAARRGGRRHSLHGTVFDVPWEVVDIDDVSATFTTTLGDDWPFAATVVHHVALDPDGVTLRLMMHAEERQPAQVGWHPWFSSVRSLDHGCSTMLERDDHGIATSTTRQVDSGPWDDCFLATNSRPRLDFDSVSVALSTDCTHWVIYDEPAHATCVEPQSGPPNAVNDSPVVLDAGEVLTRWFRIERI